MTMTTPEGCCVACGAAVEETRCGQCGAVTRAGSYRVVSVLGQTPHSRTYVAEDASGRKVALKELLFAAVPNLQQMESFEREGRLLKELDHPRIPRFVDNFKEGEGRGTRLYLAQELVEGESLWARLHGGAFDEPQVRDAVGQVLEVLAYLHGRTPRVIHRDVKPHNLIARADGSIALVDFGAACELDARVTHQATLVGTYGYMPPDQLAGTVDPTSDLYALGATAMHLLTGRPPEKLVGEDLELGAGISLNVSSDFDKLIRKMAARNMARRFESAQAALVALKALPPLQARGRTRRVPRAKVAATAGIALVIAAAGTVWKLRAPAEVSPASVSGPVAPPAVTPVKAFAWEPRVQLYEAANTDSAVAGQSFPAGTELLVDRPLDCGLPFVKLLSPRPGYVRTGDLCDAPPKYDAVMQAARTWLGDAELARAEAEAERAHAVQPKEREPLALLLALFNAQRRVDDARRANDQLRALGDVPASPPAATDVRAGPDPKPEESWYVGGSTLRMRQKPSADAKILAELSINTEVEVLSVAGDWAEVKWERQAVAKELSLDDSRPQPQADAPAPVRGFVAQAFLVSEKVDKAWTLAKADDAANHKDGPEAERQLARASALDPVDRPLELRLAHVAVEARDYPVAANAAVAAVELASGAAEPLVEIKLAYRCRGERSRAEWTDDSTSVKNMSDDACVESLTEPTCEPCDCHAVEPDEELAANDRDDPVETWRKEDQERLDRLAAIDGAFPSGSWLRVKVTGPARATPDNHIIIYDMRLDALTNDECLSERPNVAAVDAGPVPPAGKDVTIWVRVGSYAGPVYGVAFGRSVESVTEKLERDTPACGPANPKHSINVSSDGPACDDCSCT
jgi:protein kinase-like protein